METSLTTIPGPVLIKLRRFPDHRGVFFETFSETRYQKAGVPCTFVQDSHSRSKKGVLRGLHYQVNRTQAKLVTVTRGSILDAVVDIRRGSPTFGKGLTVLLSENDTQQIYIPAGFAHGFYAVEDSDVVYKCSDFYAPEHERGIVYNDPALALAWPETHPTLSDRDGALPRLSEVPEEDLPVYRDLEVP